MVYNCDSHCELLGFGFSHAPAQRCNVCTAAERLHNSWIVWVTLYNNSEYLSTVRLAIGTLKPLHLMPCLQSEKHWSPLSIVEVSQICLSEG